ncbi:DUF6768 family protein [Salinimonas chungwhensis]|uniref:DUF6768 family protein n=1 Tax=Salinimonas chungwhensis TaxID=265425 RepID=UPI00037E903E|nr:DUF6768 family protein [Salinimonas chungwhensis]
MSKDNDLRSKLAQETAHLDSLIKGDESFADYLKTGFSSPSKRPMMLGYILAFLFTAALLFCGYQFFLVHTRDPVFWGVCLILSFQAQTTIKLWIYIQTNKQYQSEELRRFLAAIGKF